MDNILKDIAHVQKPTQLAGRSADVGKLSAQAGKSFASVAGLVPSIAGLISDAFQKTDMDTVMGGALGDDTSRAVQQAEAKKNKTGRILSDSAMLALQILLLAI